MKTKGLNFIEAMQAVNKGYKVRRDDLFGFVHAIDGLLCHYWEIGGNKHFCFSINHILADDWEIVQDTMTFTEAFAKMRKGKTVRRLNGGMHYNLDSEGKLQSAKTLMNCCVDVQMVEATDWVVCEEENNDE